MHNETGGSLIIYLPSGAQCEPITGFSSSRLIATLVMFRRARLLYFGFLSNVLNLRRERIIGDLFFIERGCFITVKVIWDGR